MSGSTGRDPLMKKNIRISLDFFRLLGFVRHDTTCDDIETGTNAKLVGNRYDVPAMGRVSVFSSSRDIPQNFGTSTNWSWTNTSWSRTNTKIFGYHFKKLAHSLFFLGVTQTTNSKTGPPPPTNVVLRKKKGGGQFLCRSTMTTTTTKFAAE